MNLNTQPNPTSGGLRLVRSLTSGGAVTAKSACMTDPLPSSASPARPPVEEMRRSHDWSAARIAFELQAEETSVSRRTVSRHLAALGLNHRRFIDPNGDTNREPRKITARWPGHMAHVDVKKVGRIPDGGGWRIHGRGSAQTKKAEEAKRKTKRGGYVYLHSAIDGFSRLAYTEALPDEKAVTAMAFLHRAPAWFATHGIECASLKWPHLER